MKQLLIIITVGVFCLPHALVSAEDDTKRSPELKPLDYFVGSWIQEVTNTSTGTKVVSNITRKWSQGGQYVISEDVETKSKKESLFLMTYDPNEKVYRTAYMSSYGVTMILGKWNEEKRTMNWTGKDAWENTLKGATAYTDKDNGTWWMKFTNPEGELNFELIGKLTRKK